MPAAAAAPSGLLARPHDRALRRAGLGQARGLVVRAADAFQRDQRPPVRQDGRAPHGNRPLAAAAATRLSGWGASENTATSSAAAKATARVAPNTGWSSTSVPSSKYITLTMRR